MIYLSAVLFLCAFVLVKCYFIIRGQDEVIRKIIISHKIQEERGNSSIRILTERVEFYIQRYGELVKKLPKRDKQGKFTK